jgi:alkanesulfonate monooxygenase SsuD/methylene tetrahydromethanopterin reductase-like flavin-dependent oxidoreductase (luciferase family)
MEFGLQFFPSVGPEEKSPEKYFSESLQLVGMADELGYTHIRIVEHYFLPYGGYSPNPIVFLSAAAMRSRRARLITGAVLPVFNNPLKLAGEIGMLDAISGGRMEIGFARAFLPHEFQRFGVNVDESRARFEEGVTQVRRLLEDESVSHRGRFHQFQNVTSLPRPTQRPRPPIWVAALATPESFVNAGREGYNIMAIPLGGAKLRELVGAYRDAWKSAAHPGSGKVMLALHMYCDESNDRAIEVTKGPMSKYLDSLVAAASDWTEGLSSKDYPGYDKIISGLKAETFESQVQKSAIWVGNPARVADQIASTLESFGAYDMASLQVNFHSLPLDLAAASARLFSEKVMPRFRNKLAA